MSASVQCRRGEDFNGVLDEGVRPGQRFAVMAESKSPRPVEQPIVLVIDDDDSVRSSLARLFRSVGLDVETFASAQDFQRKPMPDRPACVVLDLCLSGSSGLELQASLIRAGHEVPIIFISGHADVPSSVRAMKAGAIDFLQKPFGEQALLDIIHDALRRDREARRARAEVASIRQRFETLSRRERDVLRIVIQGRLNKQIADQLGIGEKDGEVLSPQRDGKDAVGIAA